MRIIHLLFLQFLFLSSVTYSQVGTEIYLLDIKLESGEMVLSNPVNISNRIGYDNQPYFHPDASLLFYVSADAEGSTDIMELNYETNKTRKFKETVEREYSPQVTPDGKFISCIIQRSSGEQNLGKYPISGGEAIVLINKLTVGYHAWMDNNNVAVFTLPQPFSLHIINLETSGDSVIARNISRSIHKIPDANAISFIEMKDDEWYIRKFDFKNQKMSTLIKSLSGKEHDMAWASDGKIVMSDEKNIFFFEEGKTAGWKEVKLPAGIPVKTITRLAVNQSGNKMALVINE